MEGFAGSCVRNHCYTKLGPYHLISPKFPILRGKILGIGLLIRSKGFRTDVGRVILGVSALAQMYFKFRGSDCLFTVRIYVYIL